MKNQPAEWLEALRAEVGRRTQAAVAAELGVSKAQISRVLGGTYPCEPVDLRIKVEGKYMCRTLQCPVLGEISVDKCRWHQGRPFASTNPQRVLLYRACRSGCPNSELETSFEDRRIHVQRAQTERISYDVAERIDQCRCQATGDNDLHIELLERELTCLATQYNQLMSHKESK